MKKKNKKPRKAAVNILCILFTIIITFLLLVNLTFRNATAEYELKSLVAESLGGDTVHRVMTDTEWGRQLKDAGMTEEDMNKVIEQLELKELLGTCAVDYSNYLLYGDDKFANDGKMFTEVVKKQSTLFGYLGNDFDTTLTTYFNKMLKTMLDKTEEDGSSLQKAAKVYKIVSSSMIAIILVSLLAVILLIWSLRYHSKKLPVRNAWKNCGITLLTCGVIYVALMRLLNMALLQMKVTDQGTLLMSKLLAGVFNIGLYPGLQVAAIGVVLIFIYAVWKIISAVKNRA